MIMCGDFIDSQFGAVLGLTTMAAAGLGNWVSDVCGLGIGDAIERSAVRLGLNNGHLTPAQERMTSAKLVSLSAKVIGITLGCFAGMAPLLFLTPSKKEFSKEELELFDGIFGPAGLTTTNFSDFLERSTRRKVGEGHTLVDAEKPLPKMILMIRGTAAELDGDGCVTAKYFGRLGSRDRDEDQQSQCAKKVKLRGAVIGDKVFMDEAKAALPFGKHIVASTPVELIECGLKDLHELMENDKAIQGCMMSILYNEAMENIKRAKGDKASNQYRKLLTAVILDGQVDEREREFIAKHQADLRISDEEHFALLKGLGWDKESWARGRVSSYGEHPSSLPPGMTSSDLLRVAALLEQVASSMG